MVALAGSYLLFGIARERCPKGSDGFRRAWREKSSAYALHNSES
jgi:hypothetical protein